MSSDSGAIRAISGQLEKGERLIWAGKPPGGIRIRPTDAFMIPFSLVWAGFSFFWEYMAITSGAPFFFPLFGVPFVMVGFYLLVGRFFAEARQRKNTSYGITNKRVIVMQSGRKTRVRTWRLKDIPAPELIQKKDGTGTIVWDRSDDARGRRMIGGVTFESPEPQGEFADIPEAKQVYSTLQAAIADDSGGEFWEQSMSEEETQQDAFFTENNGDAVS